MSGSRARRNTNAIGRSDRRGVAEREIQLGAAGEMGPVRPDGLAWAQVGECDTAPLDGAARACRNLQRLTEKPRTASCQTASSKRTASRRAAELIQPSPSGESISFTSDAKSSSAAGARPSRWSDPVHVGCRAEFQQLGREAIHASCDAFGLSGVQLFHTRQRPRDTVELLLKLRGRLVTRFAHDATVSLGHDVGWVAANPVTRGRFTNRLRVPATNSSQGRSQPPRIGPQVRKRPRFRGLCHGRCWARTRGRPVGAWFVAVVRCSEITSGITAALRLAPLLAPTSRARPRAALLKPLGARLRLQK